MFCAGDFLLNDIDIECNEHYMLEVANILKILKSNVKNHNFVSHFVCLPYKLKNYLSKPYFLYYLICYLSKMKLKRILTILTIDEN